MIFIKEGREISDGNHLKASKGSFVEACNRLFLESQKSQAECFDSGIKKLLSLNKLWRDTEWFVKLSKKAYD